MRIVTMPGVFRPIAETWLLAEALRAQRLPADAELLDLCTGTGALAVAAARGGCASVTAVDVMRRAVLNTRVNARRNGVRVRALRGDLYSPVRGRRFDAIVANPPYVPAASDSPPRRGPQRAWDGGRDGRRLLHRICDEAPAHLRPGGALLLVHSSVIGVQPTLARLAAAGLQAAVVARAVEPFGPVLARRAAALGRLGFVRPGQREEELLVIRAARPVVAAARPAPSTARFARAPRRPAVPVGERAVVAPDG